MNNNKGFTLIELITTIALLAVIVLISFVSVNRVIEKSKVNDCNSIAANIKTASTEYAADNRYKKEFIDGINKVDMEYYLTAEDLVNNNYLTNKIIDPFTKDEILLDDVFITIKFNNNYTVNKVIIEEPDILNTCVKPLGNNNTIVSEENILDPEKLYLKPQPNDYDAFKEKEYRDSIENIYFVKNMNIPADRIKEYNLDVNNEGTIKGWIVINPLDSSKYDLYIGANDTIYAKNLSGYFKRMSNVKYIIFNNLDTSEVTA